MSQTAPYWETFAQEQQSEKFTCVNRISEDWEVITRSLGGAFILCGHQTKREVCIFMNNESPRVILRNKKPTWKEVAKVNDSSFSFMRGIFGAQFDSPEPLGNLVECPKTGVSILFERVDKSPAAFRIEVSWEDKGSAKPTIETKWMTPFVGDANHQEFALIWKLLQTRIDEHIDCIRTFMELNGNSIPWDDKETVGKYHRVDFVWRPAVTPESDDDVNDESLKIVAVKRGRPAGKMDSSKRIRGPAMTPSSKIACMTTIIKLSMLFPDSKKIELRETIAGLFTLTKAFLDFNKWKKSEPLEKKFKALMKEVSIILDDNTCCFIQAYSSLLRQTTPKATMEEYDQCGGNIRAWYAEGSKCDYFLENLIPDSISADPSWYETNKKTLNSMGMKSLNALLSAERAKKQCRGVAAIVVGGCIAETREEEEDLSWNLLVEAKQELSWGREDALLGLNEHYAGMVNPNEEETLRKTGHFSEVLTGFEKVGTKLNEAICIFKESKLLKRQINALNARKQGLKGELNMLVQDLVGLIDFCPPTEIQSKAGGALFVKVAVDGILVKVDENLQQQPKL